MPFLNRIKEGWNAFWSDSISGGSSDPSISYGPSGGSATYRPDRPRLRTSAERTILASILTRLAVDMSSVEFRHVQFDEFNRYADDISSPLNDCLTFEPNMDQGPRAFRLDLAMTIFDAGVAAVVPVDTNVDPTNNEIFDIKTMRVGRIIDWFPKHVRVSLYNEEKGYRENITLEKRFVAIVENPFYAVMNEPNSTLQRLIRKLNLLDAIDEQSGSSKLDLIIQLPYVVKTETKRLAVEQRHEDIESQLKDSKYGVAYIDGSEKITQLNRPVENNLLGQIEFLVEMLYSELGLTKDVMNGTAGEKTMNAYFSRTIEPVADAAIEAMQRSWLRGKPKERRERIRYFRNPFRFMSLAELAEIADKFTRSEILTSNEFRGYLGIPPSKDPRADSLANPNMPGALPGDPAAPDATTDPTQGQDDMVQAAFDKVDSQLDSVFKDLGVATAA